nr:MAG: ORF1 [TTV-like mini virus]
MPPYWRNYRNRWRRRWRRRRRPGFWRPRRTIFRKYWRTRRRVRRAPRFFYKLRLKRKLLKKHLLQWQPEKINKCKIRGQKCLFEGGPMRLSNNFYEYFGSYVPENWQGGGGWSLMVFSLDSLYEDFNLLQNYWTKSNAGLPLVTYQGCKLKFYQSQNTDYVVKIDRCWPMVDTPLTHANSHPQRMLLDRKTIKIPALTTRRKRKAYKKVWVKPPTQMMNKWYFQQDIASTKLLMLTATSCDLVNTYLSPKACSNNITLIALNVNFFQNQRFQNPSATTGWQPKNDIYMYAHAGQSTTKPTRKQDLVYLGNTKDYQRGKPLPEQGVGELSSWGNPFWHEYIHGEIPVYTSTKSPLSLSATFNSNDITEMTEPYAIRVRYNPDKDTGDGNVAYFAPNSEGIGWIEPGDESRKIHGLPLWVMLWGWPDWIKKLNQIHFVDDNWVLCIKSRFFDQKLTAYVFLDEDFFEGKGPYSTDPQRKELQHWYPKFLWQQQSTENICQSGPSVNRPPSNNSVQAKITYEFYFKWGGCPRQLEKVYDPSQQQRWPTPNRELPGLQIKDPKTSPETYFYPWDVREDFITKRGLQRVTEFQETDETLLSIKTGCKSNPETIETFKERHQETSDEEEEKKTLLQQLRNLRHNQRQLRHRILRLISPTLE